MLNKNTLLFIVCSLIWGSTWIALTFQVNETAVMFSVAVRFALAAIIIGAWSLLTGKSLSVPFAHHKLLIVAGVFLYTLDYSFLYAAQQHMISALLAVLSSAVIYFNVALRRIVLGKPLRAEVIIGATIGLVGITLIFAPEFKHMQTQASIVFGLLFATGSFFSASVGNVLSEKILEQKITVTQMNFWAMTYGVMVTFCVVFFSSDDIVIPTNINYYYALLYLAVFGSVFAFAAYMKLLQNIGSDKAAYVVLVYPIVALLISTVFEGYSWSLFSILGVLVVLFGNAIAMGKFNRIYARVT